jgi:hypothetical protein
MSLAGLSLGGASAEAVHSSVASKPICPSFAIADFDGDLHPDLASIEVASTDSHRTVYSIQLQLTAGGRQTIRVVAPSGGLQILARDVNGDHAIDLVLATAALDEPVAILLNDGHGAFKQVDQADFPGAFRGSRKVFASDDSSPTGAADAPPSWRPNISVASNESSYLLSNTLYPPLPNTPFLLDISLTSRPSRAPPDKAPRL